MLAVFARAAGRLSVVRPRDAAGPLVVALGVAAAVVVLLHHHAVATNEGMLHHAIDHGVLMAAVMLPVAAPSARLVVVRALRNRWASTLVAHAIGYGAVWLAFGILAALVIDAVGEKLGGLACFGVLAAAATAWQVSFVRRKLTDRRGWLRSGPPTGVSAVTADAAGGAGQAWRCVETCWVPMLAMTAAPNLPLMGVVLAIDVSEWLPGSNPYGRRRRIRPAWGYATLALGALTWSLVRTIVRA